MAENNFSDEQLSAINTRDRTLLVSAAAGSGKTTTLTERIIRSLLDEDNPESLQNMLIVTFTNAVTADLNRKIAEALKEAIKANPENKRLERELHLLPGARISTIDSFCNDILRSNADKVGVPPNYRLAEKAETTILTDALLDALINAIYEGDMPEVATTKEFERLASCLTDSKTTKKLAEIFRLLHTKSKSAIEGVRIYELYAELYNQSEPFAVENVPYGRDLMTFVYGMIKYYADVTRALARELSDGTENERLDGEAYLTYADIISALAENTTYASLRLALSSIEFPKIPKCPKDAHTEELDFCRERFTEIKKALDKIYEDYFVYTEDEWRTLFSEMHSMLTVLSKFIIKFDGIYMQEKLRRGMLEHADVSRYTYECLYNPDGTITDIAKAYASRLTSVYIDEYQDVNALQDAIFSAISSNNRFMVGDIKQSIYSFRSAKPEIFAEMKTNFPKLDTGADKSLGASIFMSKNFRCDEGIIKFVNTVFDRMFSIVKESIGYMPEDALAFSKVYKNGVIPPYTPAKIFILEKPISDDALGEEELENTLEPQFIAQKIKELVPNGTLKNGDGIKYSDIAILVRKKDGIDSFAEALTKLGIPYETPNSSGFFMNSEVLLTLCLLNAIDNPSKDVYLAGLMCSPLYGFTADDLLKYRISAPDSTLYRSIRKYSEETPNDAKLSHFLTSLAHYRCLAEGMNVDALIYRLYSETGLLALASKHGGKENLMLLYNYARKFEGSSFKGLYNFINYVNNVAAKDEGLEDGDNKVSDSDSVKIVTVHSSKGLEYPIVFLAEASRRLHNIDLTARVAYSEGYGVSFYLREPDGLCMVRNPVQHIIRKRMNEKFYEEELRVLYVALTRAREELFVVGNLEYDSLEDYERDIRIKSSALSPYGLTKLKSYLDIIMASGTDATVEFVEANSIKSDKKLNTGAGNNQKNKPKATASAHEVYTTLAERFTFTYPDDKKTTLPEKMSVSRLYPAVLDGTEESTSIPVDEPDERRVLPSFFTGEELDESARRGIATHMVLQFCDLQSIEENGAERELDRLCTLGFLSPANKERVRLREIELFAKSKLFSEMKNAKNVWREFRFNTSLPAEYFSEDAERRSALSGMEILVQGVIDCIIEDAEGNYHLVDYKTDRLTREEFSDHTLARAALQKKHALQLTYYTLAIEKIFGKKPKTVSVYSTPIGKSLPIKTLDCI